MTGKKYGDSRHTEGLNSVFRAVRESLPGTSKQEALHAFSQGLAAVRAVRDLDSAWASLSDVSAKRLKTCRILEAALKALVQAGLDNPGNDDLPDGDDRKNAPRGETGGLRRLRIFVA